MAEARVSQLALLAELEAQVVRVSQVALLVEIDQVQIRVSQLALLVELEYEPPQHQAGGPASSAGTAAGATTTPAAAPAAGKAATAPAAATVSAAAAAYGSQLFMAMAASKAAVAPTTVLSLGGSGGAGGMSEVRSVVATVSVDWDRNGSFTDESSHLVSVRGSQNLVAPEALLGGGRGAVAGCSIVLSNHDFRYSMRNTTSPLYAIIASGGAYLAPVRVVVTIDGTAHRLFTGVLRSMNETAPTARQASSVTLECRSKDELLLQDKQSTALTDFIADSAAAHTEDYHLVKLLERSNLVDGTDFVSQAYTAELTTNGGFTSNLNGWSGANWAWEAGADGQARHTAGSIAALTQNVTVVANMAYRIVLTMTGRTAGSVTVALGSVLLDVDGDTSHEASAQATVRAAATGAVALNITPTSAFDGAITAIAVNLAPTIDPGIFPLNYVWLDDESVLDELWNLVAACCGWFYCDADGVCHYHNITAVLPTALARQFGALTTIDLTESQIAGLQLTWQTSELYGTVTVEVAPRAPGEVEELWTPDDPVVVQPGATKTVWARLNSPLVATPTLTWKAFTSGGIEITTGLSVTPTYSAQRVKLVLANTGTQAAYFNTLTLTGQVLIGGRTTEVEAASSASFWTGRTTVRKRSVRGNVYIQLESQAQTIADYLLKRQELPVLQASVPNLDRADVRLGWPVAIQYAGSVSAAGEIVGIVSGLSWSLDKTGFHQDVTILETASLFAGFDPIFILGTHKLGASGTGTAYLFY